MDLVRYNSPNGRSALYINGLLFSIDDEWEIDKQIRSLVKVIEIESSDYLMGKSEEEAAQTIEQVNDWFLNEEEAYSIEQEKMQALVEAERKIRDARWLFDENRAKKLKVDQEADATAKEDRIEAEREMAEAIREAIYDAEAEEIGFDHWA